MSIVESTVINVLNYSDSYATIQTQIKPDGYLFEPTMDEQPFAIPLSFAEIRVVNSQSNIFREGILRFDPEFEKDVYEKLGIRDWEQILNEKQIRDIILHPTKEGLEKIVKITSPSLLEKVRGMLIMLENTGAYDISIRVKNVVNTRHEELYNNKRISSIVITPTVTETVNTPTQVISEEALALLRKELTKEIRAELKQQIKNEVTAPKQTKRNKNDEILSDNEKS